MTCLVRREMFWEKNGQARSVLLMFLLGIAWQVRHGRWF